MLDIKFYFQEASSYDAQIRPIKQKNAYISWVYITDFLKNYISIGKNIAFPDTYSIIRLSNNQTSNENQHKEYYDTYRDLDGKK